ncbi:class A beta-lactamase, subclass A2 [Solitalea lacus]|uniref:class A beta-lactamase, subclass A2 n=1 Tax=Solitalea lacus TaxID=2911172 RepID=UPI003B848D55
MTFMSFTAVYAQSLRNQIEQISQKARGNVGIAVLNLESGDSITFNGNYHFPMQSVYKFPLAMAVLHAVDKGVLNLSQKIYLTKRDLLPNTWSPLRDKYPAANVNVTIKELLHYTVSLSDNNGCDILFRLMGGPKKVEEYVHALGVKEIAIVATEEEMHQAWDVQYTNWSKPTAMLQLFKLFYNSKVLSDSSTKFLWDEMAKSPTGMQRLRGQLPDKTVVAHKTGTSGAKDGITGAINDAGIIVLPNGQHLAIVVFISNSLANDKVQEEVIANIAKAVWDSELAKK